MFTIITENGETKLFYNGKMILRNNGDLSLPQMVESLQGYIYSSLEELPKEITFLKETRFLTAKEEILDLEMELATSKKIQEDITSFIASL